MSNICAGIGRGQMEVLEKHLQLRREMNSFYHDLFQELPFIKVFSEPNDNFYSNHWLTAITLNLNSKESKSLNDFRLHLEANNIESRPLWKPMHLQPIFKSAPYYGGDVAAKLFENGLCLPSGSNLTVEEKDRIKSSTGTFFKF
jgi:dTDP-4-amino-4,6-dideoxygalactose transaminase